MPRLLLALVLCLAGLVGCPTAPGTSNENSSNDGSSRPDNDSTDVDVAELQPATWLILGYSSDSSFTGTAFAISNKRFATTARMVQNVQRVLGEANPHAYLFQNETGARRIITHAWIHPEFSSQATQLTTPDVGVLHAEPEQSDRETAFTPVTLATQGVLEGLDVLDDVITCGYPPTVAVGIDLANVVIGDGSFHPRATCVWGALSTLRPLDPTADVTPDNSQLLQYVIPDVRGMAGSPILNAGGEVIGLHIGSAESGENIHFALRADKLRELISLIARGQVTQLLNLE